jgi:hypothetical protein
MGPQRTRAVRGAGVSRAVFGPRKVEDRGRDARATTDATLFAGIYRCKLLKSWFQVRIRSAETAVMLWDCVKLL